MRYAAASRLHFPYWQDPRGANMERKLLITVGDDPNSLYGVHFVSSFFRNKGDMKLTLLHIAPAFESMEVKEGLRLHEMDQILSKIYTKKGHEALEKSKGILLSQDFPGHQISTKLISKHYGMIRDVLEEAKQGHYHAIALGRRGYSIFEKALYPRISQEVMGLNIDFPFWVCRRPQKGLKNVLLCVDGSDNSLRAARHVGFMVGREEQHKITLFFCGRWKQQGHGSCVQKGEAGTRQLQHQGCERRDPDR
jgi:hypothetical protein